MRGPWTALPLLRLSIRRWIVEASAARAIRPSKTSNSRTRWPLPTPPIDGLHDSWPRFVVEKVISPTRAPRRAAAAAASQPAWPPPRIRTSYMGSVYGEVALAARTHSRSAALSRPSPLLLQGGVFHVEHHLPRQKRVKRASMASSTPARPVNRSKATRVERSVSARRSKSVGTVLSRSAASATAVA